MRRETKDLLLALGLLLFFVWAYFYVVPWGIFVPTSIKIPVMSPAFFPQTVIIFIVALSLILAIQSIIAMKVKGTEGRDDNEEAGTAEADQSVNRTRKIIKISAAMILLILYYEAVIFFGMLPASIVFLVLFSLLYGERRFKITVPLAILLPALIYTFFTVIAKIPLPKGIFFE